MYKYVLKNRELENLNLDERLKYFDELKRSCMKQSIARDESRFLVRIISAFSPKTRNYEFEILGDKNIPANANVLFVSNHSNSHDFLRHKKRLTDLAFQLLFWRQMKILEI